MRPNATETEVLTISAPRLVNTDAASYSWNCRFTSSRPEFGWIFPSQRRSMDDSCSPGHFWLDIYGNPATLGCQMAIERDLPLERAKGVSRISILQPDYKEWLKSNS